jgi:TRAP-type C4-dicarboxylate transport system permease small subunit
MNRTREILIFILERLIGIMFMVIAGITMTQVTCRVLLRFSKTRSHQTVIQRLLWVVWLSVPVGLDRREHLSITILSERLPERAGACLVWINWAMTIFFFGLVFFLTFPVIDAFEGMNMLTMPIPTNARYYAATVGTLLSVFVLATGLFKKSRGN